VAAGNTYQYRVFAVNAAGPSTPATVSNVIYFGDHLRLRCALAGQPQATVKLPLANGEQPIVGQTVWLQFPSAYLRIYA